MTNPIYTHAHTNYRAVHELYYHIANEVDCVIVGKLRETV